MRFVTYIKYSLDLPQDVMTRHLANHIADAKRKQLMKGKTYIPKEIQFFEQDADNVIHNRVTVVTRGELYKIPRIANPLKRN